MVQQILEARDMRPQSLSLLGQAHHFQLIARDERQAQHGLSLQRQAIGVDRMRLIDCEDQMEMRTGCA